MFAGIVKNSFFLSFLGACCIDKILWFFGPYAYKGLNIIKYDQKCLIVNDFYLLLYISYIFLNQNNFLLITSPANQTWRAPGVQKVKGNLSGQILNQTLATQSETPKSITNTYKHFGNIHIIMNACYNSNKVNTCFFK